MAEKKKKRETPLLDELTKGPWPSFVKEFKKMEETKEVASDLLGQLEYSYKTKIGYWKHGGIVGVMGYGGGVIGRYSALPEQFRRSNISTPCVSTIRPVGFIPRKRCANSVISGKSTDRV